MNAMFLRFAERKALNSAFPKRCPGCLGFFICICFCIMLVSCGAGVRARSLLGGKLHVTVNISDKVNQNAPIATDLLLVYNEKLCEDLLKMSAKDWFRQKEQIKRDYIEGVGLDCWSWEWVPGQKIPIQKLPLKSNAKAGIVFADYLSPGAHRIRFSPFEDIVIRLLETDFFVDVQK